MLNKLLRIVVLSAALAFLPGPAAHAQAGDIVDVAASAGSFETLLTAVGVAGLTDVLKSEGPFTVFAPTDEAFAKIPESDLSALLADEEALTAVLLYHVVPGKVTAAQVAGLDTAETANGERVRFRIVGDQVKVDEATVLAADVEASNGLIHVIDQVILPPAATGR